MGVQGGWASIFFQLYTPIELNRKDYLTLNADAVIDFLAFLLVTIPTGILHIILDRGRKRQTMDRPTHG